MVAAVAPPSDADYERLFASLDWRAQDLTLALPHARLPARLHEAPDARGLVVFGHGSVSSLASPHDAGLAERLAARGWSCLLLDLRTDAEEREERARFDVRLAARRLEQVVAWTDADLDLAILPLALYGHATGAAPAAIAAERASRVRALVTCGGRLDYAGDELGALRVPTLLVAGASDATGAALARLWAERARRGHEVAIVPGAGHAFEREDELDALADVVATWLEREMGGA